MQLGRACIESCRTNREQARFLHGCGHKLCRGICQRLIQREGDSQGQSPESSGLIRQERAADIRKWKMAVATALSRRELRHEARRKRRPYNRRNVPYNRRNVPYNRRNVPYNRRNVPCNRRHVPCNRRHVPCNRPACALQPTACALQPTACVRPATDGMRPATGPHV